MSITWIKLIVLVCIITSIYPYNFFCIKIYFLCSLTSYTKINSKWIGDLSGSLYTMKLLCLLSRFQSCLTLWFMGSQRVGHDWAMELNWTELTLCDSLDCSSPGYSCQWDSPGKNTGVGCHAFLQGICPTQGWNPCL